MSTAWSIWSRWYATLRFLLFFLNIDVSSGMFLFFFSCKVKPQPSDCCCLHTLFGFFSFLHVNGDCFKKDCVIVWHVRHCIVMIILYILILSLLQIKCFSRAEIIFCLYSCACTVREWTRSTASSLLSPLVFSFNHRVNVWLFAFEFADLIHLKKEFGRWKQTKRTIEQTFLLSGSPINFSLFYRLDGW